MRKYRILFCIAVAVYTLNAALFSLSLLTISMQKLMFPIVICIFVYVVVMYFLVLELIVQDSWKRWKPQEHLSGWRKTFYNTSSFVAVISFVVCLLVHWKGSGAVIDGEYWLRVEGDLIRQIDQTEYQKLVFMEVRMIYGFLLVFTAMPVACLGEALCDKSE